ncbi:DUF1648 domain-containing protein [Streptomyces iconiensis]|uniref:DUF1648 domain-containing protein n=1 Tax=Streptomyces iconiensis TaxID=1384038 RepID=A0ABT7A075_9ACTN|nr:DUF1648 domain-containing protein [Streptomyces iconiensis]MDJ1134719.1 DUF1648 domain-containing protein [Streptomyces iconiensis]
MRTRPGNTAAVPFAATPFLLAGAVVLAVMARVWSRLPGEMGVHFGADGTADRFLSRPLLLVFAAALFAGLAVWLGALAYWGGMHGRALTGGSAGAAIALGYLFAALLLVNLDVTDAAALEFPWWHGAIAVGAALVAGFTAGRVLPAPGPAKARGKVASGSGQARPSVGLRAGELAVWQRTLGPVWLTALSAGLTVGVLGAWLLGAGPGSVLWALPLTVLLLLLSGARVTVSREGLAVRPPLAGPRFLRVPLTSVVRAEARPVRPVRDLGGWGYRLLPGRRGLALHAGTGVWVELESGGQFVVVVRDAETAAGLLNDLVARERC